MALEDKIRKLLAEHTSGETVSEDEIVTEAEDAGGDNAKIKSGLSKKLEAPTQVNGAEVEAANKGKGDPQEASTKYANAKIEAGKGRKLETKNEAKIEIDTEDADKKGKDDKDEDDDSEDDESKDHEDKESDADETAEKDGEEGDDDDEKDNDKFNVKVKKDNPFKEHIDALTSGEDLSEEFKTKAATIFEAAVHAGVQEELARLEEEYDNRLNEAADAIRDELVENIDGFLNEVVEAWMADNELALEHGIKNEVLENFVDGLKNLFKETYIEVPEEKLDILDEQATKIDEMDAKLAEQQEIIDALSNEVVELTMKRIQESVGEALTDTDFEKFEALCEGIEFDSEESYEEKVKTVKESYFPKNKRDGVIAESDSPVPMNLVEGAMSKYVDALSGSLAFKR